MDIAIRSEVNESLRVLAAEVYGKTKGRKRKPLDAMTRKFNTLQGQTISLSQLKQKNELVNEDLEKWKQTCVNLNKDVEKLS